MPADIGYSAVQDGASGSVYLLASARLMAYYKDVSEYEVLKTYTGAELAGVRYEPIFLILRIILEHFKF